MGIEEVLTVPRSPWQKAFVERFIGAVRRECLYHVIVFNEAGLMTLYRAYYEHSRTHLSLDKDAPIHRLVTPARDGAIVRGDPGGRRAPSSIRTPRGLNTPEIAGSICTTGAGAATSRHGPAATSCPRSRKVANVPALRVRGTRSTV
jgi:hypothetical protein